MVDSSNLLRSVLLRSVLMALGAGCLIADVTES